MNDFERRLERELRQMLDPVVATRPPTPRGPFKRVRTPLLVLVAPFERATVFGGAAAEMIPVPIEQPAVP
jgi:hypothetical protein